jgi:hypothetical protein
MSAAQMFIAVLNKTALATSKAFGESSAALSIKSLHSDRIHLRQWLCSYSNISGIRSRK